MSLLSRKANTRPSSDVQLITIPYSRPFTGKAILSMIL